MTKMLTKQQFLRFKIWFFSIICLLLWSLLLWQYFHGGIPGHHFLADKNMPLVSNGWGALVIPVFIWLLMFRIETRLFKTKDIIDFPNTSLYAFLGALLFGISLGLSIYYQFKIFSGNVPLILFVLALFVPTYRSEYYLGFVLGLTWHIGGVLPVLVGSVFVLFSAGIYIYLRKWILFIFNYIFSRVK